MVGSRFAATFESSGHAEFKNAIVKAKEGDTVLTLKQLTPVRMIRNKFYEEVERAEKRGADVSELQELLGRGRAKLGMFEGQLGDGELEIGQVSGMINDIRPAAEVLHAIYREFRNTIKQLTRLDQE